MHFVWFLSPGKPPLTHWREIHSHFLMERNSLSLNGGGLGGGGERREGGGIGGEEVAGDSMRMLKHLTQFYSTSRTETD